MKITRGPIYQPGDNNIILSFIFLPVQRATSLNILLARSFQFIENIIVNIRYKLLSKPAEITTVRVRCKFNASLSMHRRKPKPSWNARSSRLNVLHAPCPRSTVLFEQLDAWFGVTGHRTGKRTRCTRRHFDKRQRCKSQAKVLREDEGTRSGMRARFESNGTNRDPRLRRGCFVSVM